VVVAPMAMSGSILLLQPQKKIGLRGRIDR
jgi:hypothetical protein